MVSMAMTSSHISILVFVALGCTPPKASDDEAGEDTGCVEGVAGCPCYGNGTCNEGLVCAEDQICEPSDCSDGAAGCPCYGNGTCDAGSICNASNLCEPAGVDDTTTTEESTTDDSSSSESDSSESTTSESDSTTGGDPCEAVPDDMVCVPAGIFEMGTDLNSFLGSPVEAQERPAHDVTISQAFWIDKTEVTASAYAECWGAQACSIPSMNENPYPTWAVAGKENHPINGVNWYQAKDYCEWKGKRLPTEAEWEYAARGDDARMYTWGNEAPTCSLVVGSNCGNPPGTVAVGTKPAGASPFGALDMISNMLEWCADYYQPDYYYISPEVDPQGPDLGTTRVIRVLVTYVQSADPYGRATGRYGFSPIYSNHTTGFRCAQDPP